MTLQGEPDGECYHASVGAGHRPFGGIGMTLESVVLRDFRNHFLGQANL